MLSTITLSSPVGRLAIRERDGALVAIDWIGEEERSAAHPPTPLLAAAARQLQAYFAGQLTQFDLPVAPAGSPFQQRVWAAMRAIPYGETRSYKALAEAIGSAPRPVGGACGRNPIPIVIPCHRVLATGGPGGYSGSGGLQTKHFLLELEGARPAFPAVPHSIAQSPVTPAPTAAIVPA